MSLSYRPALALPHLAVPTIAHLDWPALKAAGVRALVFDKDNCITRPLAFQLEPKIQPAFKQAVATFGLSRILVVSNSAGSSSDTDGLGAERLSRALGGVPVLCHPHKKPALGCARSVIDHFERVQAGLIQIQERREGANEGVSRNEEATLRSGFEGAIAVIGDRTLTDVAFAHRIGDELLRRRGRGSGCRGGRAWFNPLASASSPLSNSTSSSSSSTVSAANLLMTDSPPIHSPIAASSSSALTPFITRQHPGVAILTTRIWEREGILNDFMRFLERRIVASLVRSGLEPGQRGWRRTARHPNLSASAKSTVGLPTASRDRARATIGYQIRTYSTSASNGDNHDQKTSGETAKGTTGLKMDYSKLTIALIGFFIVVPISVYGGARLKAWSSENELLDRADEVEGADAVAVEAVQLAKESKASEEASRRAKLKRLAELRNEEYLMLREKEEVEAKMARLRQRQNSAVTET
ncbi:hypothetical protein OC861_002376 [Tilletia horrida]|nr:hypothetical protein OC845_004998 [Tilletia horrida]KAK0567995.1 hypothetical protein OC861_002376 [Tilletia horrida]